jgi:hypothetical protein
MKRVLVISTLVLLLMASYSFAHMQQGMTGSPGYGTSEASGDSGNYMMGHHEKMHGKDSGMMGYGGYGMMGPGAMGYGGSGIMGYGMGQGMMGYGGCGMMGPGAMGYGGYGMMGRHQMMHGMGYGMGQGMAGYGGCGMMGHGMGPGMMHGYDSDTYEKFMNDTKDLRKKLHDKKFEYYEAVRQPDITREDVSKIEKEMWEIKKNINDKWQQ